MEHPVRPLTTREAILLIVHANGNRVTGRTVLQKLAYFSSLSLGRPLGHRAHYYGPYSRVVEDAAANAVIAGTLRETAERMTGWGGGPERLKYTYDLEPSGQARVDELIESHADDWHKIRSAVGAVKGVLPDLDQKTLSSAAKTYLIISESDGEGVDPKEIPAMAEQLGWDLDGNQVEQTIEILKKLALITPELEPRQH
jgi:uncharacterized protein YwgA